MREKRGKAERWRGLRGRGGVVEKSRRSREKRVERPEGKGRNGR